MSGQVAVAVGFLTQDPSLIWNTAQSQAVITSEYRPLNQTVNVHIVPEISHSAEENSRAVSIKRIMFFLLRYFVLFSFSIDSS